MAEWVATPILGASYAAHLLTDPPRYRGRGYGIVMLALCGEGRRQWQPIEAFENPSAFSRCEECIKRAALEGRDG